MGKIFMNIENSQTNEIYRFVPNLLQKIKKLK